tara:strand:+ start:395 stop:496 length:102 start_codon:yes stop_codon:yes gene_type:complete
LEDKPLGVVKVAEILFAIGRGESPASFSHLERD